MHGDGGGDAAGNSTESWPVEAAPGCAAGSSVVSKTVNPSIKDPAISQGGGFGMGVSGMVFVGLVLGCIEAKFCK